VTDPASPKTPATKAKVDKESMSENELVKLIAKQLKIDTYSQEKYPDAAQLKDVISSDQAQRFKIIPLKKVGKLLVIAMTDPSDIRTQDQIRQFTNLDVEPVICTDAELNQLAQLVYGTTFNVKEMMSSLDGMDADAKEEDDGALDVSINTAQDMATEAPVIKLVNSILMQACREKTSDIHISPEKDRIQLRFRIDGQLKEFPAPPKSYFFPIISRIKLLSNMDISVTRIPQDGRFTFKYADTEVSVRASALPTIYGENMVLRLLQQSKGKALTLEDLGFDEKEREKFLRAIQKPYGMVLATGPTGSGKSTLLYALLRKVNKPNINIITLEDPVEYRMDGIRQVQLNRKAGMTFASGLRSILRQDPNVIMVGEIRDQETAHISIESALTGHLLLSTLHANTSSGAVTRFVEMGIEPFLVASTLLVCGAQRLVRRICPHCLEPYEAPLEAMAALGLQPIPGTLFLRGKGCYQCNETGYQGRCGVYEILDVANPIKDLIIKGASMHEIEAEAVRLGLLRTLIMDAADKVLRGFTTLEEAGAAVLI
jgi:type IV pilus assembly protein PilB